MFILKSILVFFFVFSPLQSFAALQLYVYEKLSVYDEPDGEEITYLTKGDKVPVSPKLYDGHRKVLVTFEGKRKAGYILIDDILRSKIKRTAGRRSSKGYKFYRDQGGVGLTGSFAYLQQGEREFNPGSGEVYNISSFESSSVFFGAFYDRPLEGGRLLRIFANMRQTNFKGDASINLGPAEKQPIELDQSLLGIGIDLKFYTGKTSTYWWAPGAEIGKGTNVGLVINDTSTPLSDDDLPFFIIGSVAAGWDIPVGSLFLIPEIRLGVIVNTDPVTMLGQFNLSLAYGL